MGRGGKGKGGKGKGGKGGKAAGDKKRQKVEQLPYEEGERGFLVSASSCQNALRGSKDVRLWLEVETEGEAGESTAPAPATAAEGLDAELAALRNSGSTEALLSRRFLPIGTLCRQVAFLKVQQQTDVPSKLANLLLRPGERKPLEPPQFTSRFAEQVFPVDITCRPRLEEFESLAMKFLTSHAGRTWRLVYEEFRGGWNTISREDAMRMCRAVLKPENLSVSEPQVTILCTVNPRFVGLAAMENLDAEDLRVKYGEEDSTEDEMERMRRRHCRYGANCTRRDCIFKHPEDRVPLPPMQDISPAEKSMSNAASSDGTNVPSPLGEKANEDSERVIE
eukprot:TRINITY_DN64426_c0_g1_i1.p1 TRINITY_DN64426_c0_g1~~TRINITY_DN64426_c0_g1_i1.p1  ORF type:complete len:336 (+),score=43.90 TRINITY_DN64426_c0_g1_i1:41-1048(+)